VFATPRFISQSILRVYAFTSGANSGGSVSLGGNAAPGAYIFRETIASWNCFQHIKPLNPEKFWSQGDFFERYGGLKSFFLKNPMRLWSYYKGHVYGHVDDESGLVEVTVVSFDRAFSYALNKEVVRYARDHLNKAGLDSYNYEVNKVKEKIAIRREILVKDLDDLANLQKKTGIANFDQTYAEILSIESRLEDRRVDLQSKSSSAALFARHSEELRDLEERIRVVSANIDKENLYIKTHLLNFFQEYKIKSSKVAEDLEVILMGDRNLQDLERFLYTSSYHVDLVEEPFSPSDPTAPRKLEVFGEFFLLTFVLYIVIK